MCGEKTPPQEAPASWDRESTPPVSSTPRVLARQQVNAFKQNLPLRRFACPCGVAVWQDGERKSRAVPIGNQMRVRSDNVLRQNQCIEKPNSASDPSGKEQNNRRNYERAEFPIGSGPATNMEWSAQRFPKCACVKLCRALWRECDAIYST